MKKSHHNGNFHQSGNSLGSNLNTKFVNIKQGNDISKIRGVKTFNIFTGIIFLAIIPKPKTSLIHPKINNQPKKKNGEKVLLSHYPAVRRQSTDAVTKPRGGGGRKEEEGSTSFAGARRRHHRLHHHSLGRPHCPLRCRRHSPSRRMEETCRRRPPRCRTTGGGRWTKGKSPEGRRGEEKF